MSDYDYEEEYQYEPEGEDGGNEEDMALTV